MSDVLPFFDDRPSRAPQNLDYAHILKSIDKSDYDELDSIEKSMGGPNKLHDLIVGGMIIYIKNADSEPTKFKSIRKFKRKSVKYKLTSEGKAYLSISLKGNKE